MTITISISLLAVLGLSVLLFIAVTWLCNAQGLFDGSDTWGIGALFAFLTYVVLWLVPSLVGVIVYLAVK